MINLKKMFMVFTALSLSAGSLAFADGANDKSIAILQPTGKGKLPDPLPSGIQGNPETPLSSEKMVVSGNKIDTQVQQALSDADARLSDINLNAGLTQEHEDSGTLKSEIRASKTLREMQYKQAEVDAAIKLWGSAYDGAREYPKQKENNNNKPEEQKSANTQPNNNTANAMAMKEAELAAEKNAELEKEREKEQQHETFIKQRRALAASIPPVISSIFGPSNDLKAVILIPYVGSKEVSSGDKFAFIDGTIGKVQSITSDNVTVSRNGASDTLTFGTHVPSRSEIISLLNDDPSQKKKDDNK